MRWRYRHTVLSLCVLAYFAIRFAQIVISPVVPRIIDDFAVSKGTIGLALTGMWVAYALSQLPSGVFGDRFGERSVVLVALGLTVLASVALVGAFAFVLFVAVVVFLGIGAGLYYNAATALLARSFDDIGRAIGSHRIGGQGAGLVAPVVATMVAVRYGWRASILLGGIVALVVLVAFTWRVRPTEPIKPEASVRAIVDLRGMTSFLGRPSMAYATTLAILGEFAGLTTLSFLPTFLVEYHGLPIATAGVLFSAYFATIVVSQPLTGWFSDRVSRDAALGGTMFVGVVGYVALLDGSALPVVIPAVFLTGVAMSWGPPIQSRVMDGLDDDERGFGFGLVRTLYILVGALGNTIVGSIADAAGWIPAFGLLAISFAVAFLLIALNRLLRLGL